MDAMEDKLVVPQRFKNLLYGLIGIGIISLAVGFVLDPHRAWANYLLNNYYFVSLAIGLLSLEQSSTLRRQAGRRHLSEFLKLWRRIFRLRQSSSYCCISECTPFFIGRTKELPKRISCWHTRPPI